MSEPLHARIADRLRALASASAGLVLPREVDLAARWGVSRATVRQAFDALVREGLVERRRRAGTVAVAPANRLEAWRGFRADLAARGIAVVDRRAAFRRAHPPGEVAAALAAGTTPALWRLDRLRGDAGGPLVRFRSWFAPAVPIAPGDDPRAELWRMLAGRGCRPATSHEELRAIPADAGLARDLAVPSGWPILERRRLVRDAAGHPLEWNIGWYRSDRLPLTLELGAR
jgi:GntR family transcriptional regulator